MSNSFENVKATEVRSHIEQGDSLLKSYANMGDIKSDLADQLEALCSLDSDERNALLAKQRKRLQRYSWELAARVLVNINNKCC